MMGAYRQLGVLLVLAVLVLSACGSSERPVNTGAVLETFEFETPGSFEEADFGSGILRIANGQYEIELSSGEGVLWGQGGTSHTDVVLEVLTRASNAPSSGVYGPMCRADPAYNGDGYLFTISPDGTYTIAKGEGDSYRVMTEGRSSAIVVGDNTIRAVCVGSYLGLYVNGTFVAATEDSTYTSGFPALAAGNGTFTASFDHLTVYTASLAQ